MTRRSKGASLTIQFHGWRGFGRDRRDDLFITWSLNLGFVSILGYGDVLSDKLRELRELLLWAEREQGRNGE